MNKSFEDFLNQIKLEKQVNESDMHWMVGTIPSLTEWEKVNLSSIVGHETYKIKLVDKFYTIPAEKIDWFKDNIGKTIKFKYEKSNREIMQVQIVNDNPPMTNEAINSEDLKNILKNYTTFLYNEGIAVGVPNEDALNNMINKFITK